MAGEYGNLLVFKPLWDCFSHPEHFREHYESVSEPEAMINYKDYVALV